MALEKIWGKWEIQRVASLYVVTKMLRERLDASLNCSSRNLSKLAKYPKNSFLFEYSI